MISSNSLFVFHKTYSDPIIVIIPENGENIMPRFQGGPESQEKSPLTRKEFDLL